jgi:hypothetical protein
MWATHGLLAAVEAVDRGTLTDEELCVLVRAEEQASRLLSSGQARSAAEVALTRGVS